MSMKISKRDTGLLIILGGMVVFLLLYLLVFNTLQAKSDGVAEEIETVKPQLQQLEDEYLNLANYQAGIEEYRKSVTDKLKAFPADIKEEDIMSYLLTMEADQKIDINDVAFTGITKLTQFPATVYQGGQDVNTTMDACSIGAVFTGKLTYPQLKSVLQYLYSTDTQSTVNSVGVSFNSETGGLTGSFDFSRYYISWPEAVYKPETLPTSPQGVSDLFGTSTPVENAEG